MSTKKSRAAGARQRATGSQIAKKSPATDPQLIAAQDAKREARLQRQAEERANAEHRKRAAKIRKTGVVSGVAIVLIAIIAAFIINELNKPGQGMDQEPSAHIQSVSDPHVYTTDPPTSGPHLSSLAPWGVSSTPITKELSLHNLEDGGVIISYRPDLDKAEVSRLEGIARSYDSDIIMTPYPGLSDSVALTAWTRIDRMGVVDEARIRRFIDAYRGKDHHKSSGS